MKKIFSKDIYKQTLKNLFIPALLFGIMCFLITLVGLNMNQESYYNVASSVYEFFRGGFSSPYFRGEPIAVSVAPILIVFMFLGSITFTYMAFKHLNKRSCSDFYHSLPYTRTQNYVSRLSAVLTYQYGIILLTMGIAALMLVFGIISFQVKFIPLLILGYMAGSTIIIGATTLAMSLSGNAVSNFTITAVILFLPRFLLYVCNRYMEGLIEAFVPLNTINPLLNPIANIPTGLLLDFSRLWEYCGMSETLISTTGIIYSFVVGIIYVIIAGLLMKKRNSELAGNSVANNLIAYIITSLITLPFVVIGFYFIIDRANRVGLSFDLYGITKLTLLLFVGLIIFLVMQVVFKGRLKGLVKSIPIFILVIAISFGITIGAKNVAQNIAFREIDSEEVEYVKIDSSYMKSYKNTPLYNYSTIFSKEFEFTDTVMREVVSEALNKNVDLLKTNGNIYLDRGSEVCCTFKLKSGKTVVRNIWLSTDETETIKNYLLENEEYNSLDSTFPDSENIDEIFIYNGYENSEELANQILSTYSKEYDSLDYSLKQKHREGSSYFQNNYYSYDYRVFSFDTISIQGRLNGYAYTDYYRISKNTPETAIAYMDGINQLNVSSFFDELNNIINRDDGIQDAYIEMTYIYKDQESSQTKNLSYEYNNSEYSMMGYNTVTDEHIKEIADLVKLADLDSLALDKSILRLGISMYREEDYNYRPNYIMYIPLDEMGENVFNEIYDEIYEE